MLNSDCIGLLADLPLSWVYGCMGRIPPIIATTLLVMVLGCGSRIRVERDADGDARDVVSDLIDPVEDDLEEEVVPDGPGDPGPEPVPDADASGDVPGDAAEEEPGMECTIDLGAFTPVHSSATLYGTGMFVDLYSSGSPSSHPSSIMSVESWFASGGPRSPTTYTFDGTESSDTCGLCVYYWENCDASRSCERYYFAVSGTVTFTALSDTPGERVTGSATDVVMELLDWETGGTDPSRTVCVDSVSFDLTSVWGGG